MRRDEIECESIRKRLHGEAAEKNGRLIREGRDMIHRTVLNYDASDFMASAGEG